jgi:hypothetical protein
VPFFIAVLAVLVVGVAVWAIFLRSGNTKTHTVPSAAVEPTYSVGDGITVDLDVLLRQRSLRR